jgi:site-specific recombinase XerD
VSTTAIVWVPGIAVPEPIDPRLLRLKQMVLDAVTSANSKRNYAKALDDLFVFAGGRPLTRASLMEWRTAMDKLSPSTVNVRLSAMRKLVTEAQRNGMLSAGEAENLAGVPNMREKGIRLGNWLTREQAKELLQVPDRSKLKGKRDYVILAFLVGCALRRQELAHIYRGHPNAVGSVGDRRSSRQSGSSQDGGCPDLGEAGNRHLDNGC